MIIATDREDEDALRTLQIASNQSGLLRLERNPVSTDPEKIPQRQEFFKLNGLYRRLADHDSAASFIQTASFTTSQVRTPHPEREPLISNNVSLFTPPPGLAGL